MNMHECAPTKHQTKIKIFLHLLISPRKVFIYYMDGADICGICGVCISVPFFYYSPITNALYELFGVALFFIVKELPYLRSLATLLGALLFHHVYSTAVFAFGLWDTYDPKVRSGASCAAEAKRDLGKKAYYLTMGLLTGLFIFKLFFV